MKDSGPALAPTWDPGTRGERTRSDPVQPSPWLTHTLARARPTPHTRSHPHSGRPSSRGVRRSWAAQLRAVWPQDPGREPASGEPARRGHEGQLSALGMRTHGSHTMEEVVRVCGWDGGSLGPCALGTCCSWTRGRQAWDTKCTGARHHRPEGASEATGHTCRGRARGHPTPATGGPSYGVKRGGGGLPPPPPAEALGPEVCGAMGARAPLWGVLASKGVPGPKMGMGPAGGPPGREGGAEAAGGGGRCPYM